MTNEAHQILLEELAAQIQQALLLAEQGDLIGAEALYHKVLEQKPDHPLALYGLAQLAGVIGDQELKEELLKHAIEQQLAGAPSLAQQTEAAKWLTELAELLFNLNRPTDAMSCLKQYEDILVEGLKVPPTSI